MRRFWLLCVILLAAVVVSACDTLQEPTRTVVLPTVMQLPTLTPTSEASATPIAQAVVPTATETPTDAPTLPVMETPNPEQETATAIFALILTREVLSLTPPTATATATPSTTPTPTLTATATPTPTNTASATARPTINPFALTRTAVIAFVQTRAILSLTPPAATATLTQTATPTLTPTPPPTETPPATLTPTATPTSAEPVINSFTASQLSATANAILTFSWAASADAARLETLTANNAIIASISVQPTGTASLPVPGNFGRIIGYRLVVARAGIERNALLNVTIVCQFNFFFGDQSAPPDADCPQDFGASGAGAIQTFQGGTMIYVNANGRNEIYALINNGGQWVRIGNNWDGTSINDSPPPEGLIAPRQMFNWAYYNTTSPQGAWNAVLGWATSDIDASPRSIQFETNQLKFYVDGPGGLVFRLTTTGSNAGTWIRLR